MAAARGACRLGPVCLPSSPPTPPGLCIPAPLASFSSGLAVPSPSPVATLLTPAPGTRHPASRLWCTSQLSLVLKDRRTLPPSSNPHWKHPQTSAWLIPRTCRKSFFRRHLLGEGSSALFLKLPWHPLLSSMLLSPFSGELLLSSGTLLVVICLFNVSLPLYSVMPRAGTCVGFAHGLSCHVPRPYTGF